MVSMVKYLYSQEFFTTHQVFSFKSSKLVVDSIFSLPNIPVFQEV
ncbi:hypothetical protein HMPREF9129_2015 [Peptoniphilus indolicus ATCC 29427]|uniref:Uncharacterized protein n=1 Tax=Peptoniphilus indolicus ATCC 29427 TaxID=997350 RepID=G4D6I5_9FIRM|nr:hypothetical protein HMPREF9129_2015 [Peptoniphilus indolicus ATCC 29427]